jgi:hypothetical protein
MNLKRRLKEKLKVPLWHISRLREPLERPIWIASTRRSGSTLLMRMFYSQPGMDHISQPFDFWLPHHHEDRVTIPEGHRYTSLDQGITRKLEPFLDDLLSGRIRFRNQWDIRDPDFSWHVQRLAVKELNTKPILDRIDDRFDLDVVYLVRHPIPVSRSAIARDWGHTAQAFLEDPAFVERHLDDNQVEIVEEVLAEGTQVGRFVAEWCLDNLPTLQWRDNRDWLTVTFEELVHRPEPMAELLCEQFDLPEPDRMAARVQRPTKTARTGSAETIRQRGPSHKATRWLDDVEKEVESEVGRLLDGLDINAYEADSPFPAADLLHFGRLDGGG